MHEKNSEERLSRRVVRGGAWVFALRIFDQGFGLIRLIILARILAPHDFGLMGIALLTMATLETFSQTGFQQALIQKNKNIESYLNSAWTVLILRGCFLFIVLYLIAPYAAAFFNAPEAKSIIQAIGVSVLLQAFTNIGVIYFRKELEFNKEFIYQFTGTLADFVVSVSAVLILRNVWALVFGLLAGNAVRCFVSYLIHPHRPHLSLDFKKTKELFRFGKWILGSTILIFILTLGDDIFVGKLFGATMLGFYQMAYRISNMPVTEITHVISQLTFPAYSKIQDDLPRLREAYLKVLQLTAFLAFPIAGLLFILAPDFTKIFLGEKWMPMVPAMQILCLFAAVRSIAATFGPLLHGIGHPDIITKLSALKLVLLGALIYPLATKWGIAGVAIATLLPSFVHNPIIAWHVISKINASYSAFIKNIAPPMTGTIIMVLIIKLIGSSLILLQWSSYLIIALLLLIGVITYSLVLIVIRSIFGYTIFDNLRLFLSIKD